MNKSILLLIAGTTLSGHAMAQSNVTLYGIVDTSIRYLTNADAGNNGKLSMENGAFSNSRIGFRGSEDLGGGTKAIFNLLGNFNPGTGTLSNGLLFSRTAYVGLQTRWGTLTLGRQQTPLFDILVFSFDPLTVGNYSGNEWLPVALSNGGRADNMIKYTGQFNGLTVDASYSFGVDSTKTGPNGFSGQIPGSPGKGTQYGLALTYAAGPIAVGGAFQQTRDNSGNAMTVYNASASYVLGTAKFFAGYLHSTDNTGFVDNVLYALGGKTAAFTPAKGSGRKDNAFFAGMTWQTTPALKLTGAAYYDHSQNAATNVNATDFGNGKRYALVGLAEYALSKRSELYTTIDYNKALDAASFDFPGKSQQIEFGVGIHHAF